MSKSTTPLEMYFPNGLFDEALSLGRMKSLKLREGTQYYRLTHNFRYNSHIWGTIVVPKNFLTDYASIPQIAQCIIDEADPTILYPAIIHDWGYATQGDVWQGKKQRLNKKEVDGLLLEGMEALNCPWWKRTAVYQAVNLFGFKAWNANGDIIMAPPAGPKNNTASSKKKPNE